MKNDLRTPILVTQIPFSSVEVISQTLYSLTTQKDNFEMQGWEPQRGRCIKVGGEVLYGLKLVSAGNLIFWIEALCL